MKQLIDFALAHASPSHPAYIEALALSQKASEADAPTDHDVEVAVYADTYVSMRRVFRLRFSQLKGLLNSISFIGGDIDFDRTWLSSVEDSHDNDPELLPCEENQTPSLRAYLGPVGNDWNGEHMTLIAANSSDSPHTMRLI